MGGDQTAEDMVARRCQDRDTSDSDHRDELEQTEMRSKDLTLDVRNLSRQDRKMLAIMRQIEEMEHKEKADKADVWSNQLEGRVGFSSCTIQRTRSSTFMSLFMDSESVFPI